jgi:hypothetical protein
MIKEDIVTWDLILLQSADRESIKVLKNKIFNWGNKYIELLKQIRIHINTFFLRIKFVR